MTLAEAEALNVKSRALTGGIVAVRGAKWGVLLLDTCKANAIAKAHLDQEHPKRAVIDRYLKLVGQVLEGAVL